MNVLKYLAILMIISPGMMVESYETMSGKIPSDNRPVWVKVQLRVLELYDLNYEYETFKISGYLRQWWNDSRLMGNDYDLIYGHGNTMSLDRRGIRLLNKNSGVWIPDTFISNSIEHNDRTAFSGDPFGAYHYLRVYNDGEVIYSQMVDLKIKSKLDLKFYPFDILNVSINIESYGYPSEYLAYHVPDYEKPLNNLSEGVGRSFVKAPKCKYCGNGRDGGLIVVGSDADGNIQNKSSVRLAGYSIDIRSIYSSMGPVKYSTGDFSTVSLVFVIIPDPLSILITIFLPSTVLIALSGYVFLMDSKKFGTKLSLSITALLTDIALSFSLPIPKTRQLMYIDHYLNLSYVYIWLSLIFVIMEFLSDREKTRKKKFKKHEKKPRSERMLHSFRFRHKVVRNIQKINDGGVTPINPFQYAFGIFYSSSWVTIVFSCIYAGYKRLNLENAKEFNFGDDWDYIITHLFYMCMGIGFSISFVLSVIIFIYQKNIIKKWSEKYTTIKKAEKNSMLTYDYKEKNDTIKLINENSEIEVIHVPDNEYIVSDKETCNDINNVIIT
tara:strand:+ start:511 stop:2169 length:1659 start_codon:yes stop_codon:yes gene_type:complete